MSGLTTISFPSNGVMRTYQGLGPRIQQMNYYEALTCLMMVENDLDADFAAENAAIKVVCEQHGWIAPSIDDDEFPYAIDETAALNALSAARAGNIADALHELGKAVDEDRNARGAVDLIRRKLNLT
jgi:hypothetical protein